ncbi:hypothetical protein MKW92_024555 [Papaver armeniacum]|nr:hypothetical protein MKW92_024555 [Papaver armeniacum]
MENSLKNSSAVFVDLPRVRELVVTKPPTSNYSCDSNSILVETVQTNGDDSSDGIGSCDIFDGEWVRDNDKQPYYPPGSCPFVEGQNSACYNNGRPDDQFLKWQWQWQSKQTNARCDSNNIPSFLNATDFLERLRGKKLVFAGDSLNRNMFISLLCILWNVIPDKTRVFRPSGEFKSRGDFSIRYDDYNCTVVFVWSPFLVNETNPINRRNKIDLRPETLRLDLVDQLASSVYRDADVVVFDSWHWWTGPKTNNGKNYFQEGNYLYPKLDMIKAYKKGVTTWGKWIDNNIDPNKTQIVFRGYSVSHYRGGRWNTGGKCNKETEPIMSDETYIERSPAQVKVLEKALRRMKTPVLYLNVSKLTYYRADAHPSVYGKNFTAQERIIALDHQDCVHWCLPGVPDTWNELLYASLLKAGKRSFGTQHF